MEVKHRYQCSFCTQEKTCFVFSDFATVFSMCRDCYDQLTGDFALYEVQDNFCSFCAKMKEVKHIEGFDDSLFFEDLFICKDCFSRLNELIARSQ